MIQIGSEIFTTSKKDGNRCLKFYSFNKAAAPTLFQVSGFGIILYYVGVCFYWNLGNTENSTE